MRFIKNQSNDTSQKTQNTPKNRHSVKITHKH